MKLIITLLLFTIFCNAQNKNLVVTYGLIFQNDELLSDKTSIFKTHLDYAVANPNRFLFKLKIDARGASFEIENKLSLAEKTLSDDLAFLFAKYPGTIFSFKDSIFQQSTLLGKKVFIKSEIGKGWILTSESKNIDGYLCYKATNNDRVENSISIFNHPIVAWFCPEIPFPYGPIGYGNLPGLILELQVRNTTYGVLKIDFNSNELPNYNILKNAEIISPEEQDLRLKSFSEN